jgi:hypothetical protein
MEIRHWPPFFSKLSIDLKANTYFQSFLLYFQPNVSQEYKN